MPSLQIEKSPKSLPSSEWTASSIGGGGSSMSREGESHADREYVCGWGAACINILVTFPLNKVMFRQQLYGVKTRKAVAQVHKEGLRHLYRGLLPPLMQKSISVSLMFGTYNQYQRLLYSYFPHLHDTPCKIGAAVMAGCTEAVLMPFERVQTLLQDRTYHKKFQNTMHAFKELRPFGIREYYRGLSAVLLRNGPSNVLFFMFRDKIKVAVIGEDYSKSTNPNTGIVHTIGDFISGGVLGACISTIVFPINVVKAGMQSRLGVEFISFRECFHEIYNNRGRKWRKVFRGVHLNYTRSMISWGIINASYELLKKYLYEE